MHTSLIRRRALVLALLGASAATAVGHAAPASAVVPPANDQFANATVLPASDVFSSHWNGDSTGAGLQVGEPIHVGTAPGASVWFRYTAPTTGRVTLVTTTAWDSALDVYTGGTLTALKQVASDDDATFSGQPSKSSLVSFTVVKGTTYSIALSGASSAQGAYSLAWQSNDNFATAASLPTPTMVATTLTQFTYDATAEPAEPQHAGVGGGHTAWYSFTPSYSGQVTVRADRLTHFADGVLAVYTGSTLDGLVPTAANDDRDTGNRDPAVSFPAYAGTRYYVAVDGYAASTGKFLLSYAQTPIYASIWGDAPVTEGDSGSTPATAYVKLTQAATVPITVRWATSDDIEAGQATAGQDYQAASGSVVFAPGETTKPISLSVRGDLKTEPSERFRVLLTGVSGGGAEPWGSLSYVSIKDDDVTPKLTITAPDVVEGDPGEGKVMPFSFTLNQPSKVPVSVTYYTWGGSTAVEGGDYLPVAGTLTFVPGQTTKRVDVPIVGDNTHELPETVDLVVTTISGAVWQHPGRPSGLILDDDIIFG
ncbi:Calx-beta domain-containing protein [Motilibacter aurantiacus]|uniref:Calx-beta domain-containing protein n=1 Tax=Motilibacter aurantiacus TaxID=2714955 RepID=UPI00140E9235|nr:Calx-beta domain-containing protein [Motilibacter aurantiacus]NHC46483.1 hypothetical protein [Motilibacter aurantiacus]